MKDFDTTLLKEIPNGDYLNNCDVDTVCANRLLEICGDYGDDGNDAKQLILLALKKIEVYI